MHGPLFTSFSLWASLYLSSAAALLSGLQSCRALDDSVDLPAARRAYLTRDSEPKPGEDFIQLMYILKFAYIYW